MKESRAQRAAKVKVPGTKATFGELLGAVLKVKPPKKRTKRKPKK